MAFSFEVNQIQFALFCKVNMAEKLNLAAVLQNSNRNRFDGEPLLFPSPPDAPPEIPGFVLQSRDGSTALVASSSRVDINVSYEPGQFPDIPSLLEEEGNFLQGLAEALSEASQVEGDISRMGLSVTLSADLDESEIKRVLDHFLGPVQTMGKSRTELGFLDRQSWGEFQVNRWLRLSISQPSDDSHSLVVMLDFNTVYREGYNISGDEIGQFLEMIKWKTAEEMKVFDA